MRPGSEFTNAEVRQFGNNRLAALTDAEIIEAIEADEKERLAFHRDFGPMIEQEQQGAAQSQFKQNFGPLVEQEIVDTRNRQRAEFERDFGQFEAEAERERLVEEQLARGRFEREFGGGRDRVLIEREFAQERADALAFGLNDTNGVDRSQYTPAQWQDLLNISQYQHGVFDKDSLHATEEPLGIRRAWLRASEALGELAGQPAGLIGEHIDNTLGTGDFFENQLRDIASSYAEGLIPTDVIAIFAAKVPLPPSVRRSIRALVPAGLNPSLRKKAIEELESEFREDIKEALEEALPGLAVPSED